MKIIAGDPVPAPDPALFRALRNAHRWASDLRNGTPLRRIAENDGFSVSYVARIIPLASLSPGIQTAIIDGAQPTALTLETVIRARLPLNCPAQERVLGMRA